MRSPENEAVVLGMWADYDRDGLPAILGWATEDAQWRPCRTASSPDLGGLLAEAGLPGRGITNEAFVAMHSDASLP